MADGRQRAMEAARGFMPARVLLTAVELDVFTLLHEAPADAPAVAGRLEAHPRTMERLLDCLVTLGFLDKQGAAYRVTEAGAVISPRHPESVRPMLLHRVEQWKEWSHLTESVRRGRNPHVLQAFEDPERREEFIAAMHVVGKDGARRFATACGADRYRRLLDIGGGSGVFTIAFLRQSPGLEAVLFDFPEVTRLAAGYLEEAGVDDRVELVAGDFYEDELPTGCDVALLSAIVHQNSPEQNAELFAKVHRALEPGGTLIVRDYVMSEDRTEPPEGALFALMMLVGTERGDTYTFAELQSALHRAGFTEARLHRDAEARYDRIEARK